MHRVEYAGELACRIRRSAPSEIAICSIFGGEDALFRFPFEVRVSVSIHRPITIMEARWKGNARKDETSGARAVSKRRLSTEKGTVKLFWAHGNGRAAFKENSNYTNCCRGRKLDLRLEITAVVSRESRALCASRFAAPGSVRFLYSLLVSLRRRCSMRA